MRIISGKFGRRRFDVPNQIKARPTTDFAKENLFNVLENFIDFEQIETALDLFAGTGAISYELVSRGCKEVTCVEIQSQQYNFIKKVAQQLPAPELMLIKGDALKYIKTIKKTYDFIFADPPYDLPQLSEIPLMILQNNLLNPEGILILEHSKKNDFSDTPCFLERRIYGSVNFSIFRFSPEKG